MRFRRLIPGSNNHHRTRGLVGHPLGDAAEDNQTHAGKAVGAQHDNIDRVFFKKFDQFVDT